MSRDDKCRDCKKCTERGITRLAKKAANATIIVGSLGTAAVGAHVVKGMRQNCPVCGLPMSMHSIVDGRSKD